MIRWSLADIIYLAGYLDGEGCFFAYQDSHSLRYGIACENTHKPTMEWIVSTFGGSLTTIKGKKDNHRTTYRWAVVGPKARELSEYITPYLKEKAQQAIMLIALHQTSKYPKQGRCIHPETRHERQRIVSLIKESKRVSWN